MDKKDNLSLFDLGIDESSHLTPAEIAEKDGAKAEVKTIKGTEQKTEIKESKIPKPQKGHHGANKYEKIGDVHEFLGTEPPKKADPIRQTLDYMYELTDKGIQRNKEELSAPGGRIEQGKIKLVEYFYPKLLARASKNKKLQERINKIREFVDESPIFDTATEIEKQGYILWLTTKREDIGLDNQYFNIEEENLKESRRLSNENQQIYDQIIELQKDEDYIDLNDDDSSLTLGTNDSPQPLYTASQPTIPDSNKSNISEKTDLDVPLLSDSDNKKESDDQSSTQEDEDDDELSEAQRKEIQRSYKNELVEALNLKRIDDLEGFVVESKPIELKAAISPKKIIPVSYVWPLLHTGIGIEMTPFENDEIMALNPQNTDFDTVQGLNSIFSILYKHIINQNKPKFETWLRQIVDFDIDQLIFAGHAATFKDSNYLTYECPNSKCKKVFLQKKDIMDMIEFPSDEVKQRFDDILTKDTVMKQTYTTTPKRISNDYAIGFTSQSIYSNLFEPASLSEEFSKKYTAIINIMPNIDTIYKIDNVSKKLYPIRFGVDTTSLTKTVQKKVKAINLIFKTFTPDERAIAIGEAQKISQRMTKWRLSYFIPETTCPHCGERIEKRESNPLNILFTRAQLPIVAAYIPE